MANLKVEGVDIDATGTVDGRDVSVDGAKLDTIASNATADQSDAQIETAYNNQVSAGTDAEITTGTETAIRRWSPKELKEGIVAASGAWEPNDVPLGSLLASGASFFLNGGAGVYLSMSGTADDAFVLNSPLNNAGFLYDGSDLSIKLHCRLSSSGGVGDTVGLLLDYAVVKAGDNSTTTVTNVAQVDTDVSSEVADINFSIQMSTMTGVASGTTLMVTVTRNSTGAGADSFGGNLEIISLELIKI